MSPTKRSPTGRSSDGTLDGYRLLANARTWLVCDSVLRPRSADEGFEFTKPKAISIV